jgi:hypothetical protein
MSSAVPSEWNITLDRHVRYVLPAGKYYIGDLSHALSDDIYKKTLGSTDGGSGVYEETTTGRIFLVGKTAWEEPGEFKGTDGNVFKVDSDSIGICPVSLMEKSGEGGHIYTFDSPVKCHFVMGQFTFFWDYYNALDIKTE